MAVTLLGTAIGDRSMADRTVRVVSIKLCNYEHNFMYLAHNLKIIYKTHFSST